ncbi:3-hydroxyacyl-[acyl-carrier-protein] dehydratase [Caldanaerobius fijiensis DSM 17918]|uniref:3-hydroxyacyl-[acyl-carrier-protein] dehydratase FabZ n=1 Tax=Caldanaerobius fijiensis DSM 17918 TaxID=1121256 RepID=A0A1M4USR1_9THEO|nr:3-hydroxyacyl-[acyl-carrier-protein] dehydratase [Caldanaerobius fijiensis DSM 17918]
MLDLKDIQKIIPHRYPFLLVDRVVEIGDNKIIGIKNVSGNEPYFQGHFPGKPIMPGVLIAEALAQLGAVYVKQQDEFKDKLMVLAGLDKFRFKRQVIPGDTLKLQVEFLNIKKNIGKGHGIATVDDIIVCEGEILFAAVEE